MADLLNWTFDRGNAIKKLKGDVAGACQRVEVAEKELSKAKADLAKVKADWTSEKRKMELEMAKAKVELVEAWCEIVVEKARVVADFCKSEFFADCQAFSQEAYE